ncbi:MAG: oligosaccharide flippase family protein [Candidatus Promineifilaceae bacterium]
MTLARRSLSSVTWNTVSNLLQVIISFARTILLARWLALEVFDVYPLANSIIAVTAVFANFGLDSALIHRSPESLDEKEAAAIHFTLRNLLGLVWAFVMIVGAFLLQDELLRLTLIVLTFTTLIKRTTQTPRLILARRVLHRRLAVVEFINTVLTTIAALSLAWFGAGLWALLSTDIITAVLFVLAYFAYKPFWKPRLAWSADRVRYFLRFGGQKVWADASDQALDRLDDLWTGFLLSGSAMAYYSRAYRFASYPRMILASPINLVAGGTYAELKEDPVRLSKAFFRTNAFLVRTGFLLAGIFALVAREFIILIIGAKWLPMLDAFRLMLIFTMFDPMKMTIADLFVAVGRPERIVRAKVIQLIVMVGGLILLAPPFGITGVALAVDIMLVVGIALLLWQAREFVQFSVRRLFLVPILALTLGLSVGFLIVRAPFIPDSHWVTALVKLAVFLPLYGGVLLLLEWRQTLRMVNLFLKVMPFGKRFNRLFGQEKE